jgi:hypothetical protein
MMNMRTQPRENNDIQLRMALPALSTELKIWAAGGGRRSALVNNSMRTKKCDRLK